MFTLLSSLSRLFTASPDAVQDRDEKYLSAAIDLYDLENRMRQLERERPEQVAIGPYGIALK
jgi:hypothetical protein